MMGSTVRFRESAPLPSRSPKWVICAPGSSGILGAAGTRQTYKQTGKEHPCTFMSRSPALVLAGLSLSAVATPITVSRTYNIDGTLPGWSGQDGSFTRSIPGNSSIQSNPYFDLLGHTISASCQCRRRRNDLRDDNGHAGPAHRRIGGDDPPRTQREHSRHPGHRREVRLPGCHVFGDPVR